MRGKSTSGLWRSSYRRSLDPYSARSWSITFAGGWPYWVFSIEIGSILIAIILFVDETYYDRDISAGEQPARQSRIKRLIGTEQWRFRRQRNTFTEACKRPIQAMRWPVFIPCFFYLVTFAWSVGINNALSVFLAQLHKFTPKNTGKLRHSVLI